MGCKRTSIHAPEAVGARLKVVHLLMLLALVSSVLWAQTGRGRIEGVITDPTGARVPDAKIQVIETETNSTLDLATNDQGIYVAPSLPVGTYRVVVKKEGFASVVREPILIRSEVVVRVDLTIQPGALTESVTVTGEAPILDVSTASSATSVGARVVEDLPIISSGAKRNITQLLVNLPGLTSYDPNNRESATWQPRVNGSLTGNTEAFIDGGPGTGISTGRGALEEVGPSIEMVGEFSLVTNAFNAEYGGFGNWFTNVTVKSGTNALHGSVFDHFENNKLKARSFFVPRITPGNQNEGGATLGGPVVLPKIYNGRNKTFFFVSEGLYFTRNGAAMDIRTVPTEDFKKGDFSKLVNASGAQIPIFDPTSTRSDGKGSYMRDPFTNNAIPTSMITSAAKQIAAFMTPADIPGAITNNFYSRSFSGYLWPYFNNYVTTAKVDHNVSNKQKLSVLYTNQVRHRQLQGQGQGWISRLPWGTPQWNNISPLDNIIYQTANSWRARVNHDYIISPAVLNHVTISVDRYINIGPNASTGGNWDTKLGLKGFPLDNGTFPAISFSGGTASPMNLGRGYDNRSFELRSRIDESLMWNRGKHSVKFGFYYARNQVNSINYASISGAFTFSNSMTSQPNAGSSYSLWGSSFASFLLGAVSSASTTLTDMTGVRMPSMALFAQDDWRITSKFTLSYGLRWDYAAPVYEVNNKRSSFEPDLANPGAGGLLGALAFAQTYSRGLTDSWKKGFGPRLGMAYQLGNKTVLRASGGIYYAMPTIAIVSTGYTNSPSFSSPDGYTPLYYWDSGSFPQNFVRPPVMSATFANGQAINWVPRNANRLPQIASWTFGVQRQLGPHTAIDVSYIGSHSTHLDISTAFNAVNAQNLSLGSLLLQPITSAAAVAAGYKEPFSGFANQTGANTVAQSLKPYPQYTTVNKAAGYSGLGPDGIGKMNSLQIKVNRRLSSGLTIMSYLTWSKSLTNNTAQYPLNRNMGISVDSYAVPTVFGLTWTYELPFGPGKALARWTNPAAQRLVSGWAINGFVRYQSGYPLAISASNTLSALGYSAKFADYIGGTPTLVTNPREFNPVTNRYLNAAAFAIPATYAFGNLAPTLPWLRGFSSKTESLQVGKQTAISERVGLELMLDLQNPFNFHRWQNPGTSISDSLNFGRVTAASEGRTVQISAKVTF
jgi:hypothetical protein